jgi:hypothetical protein
MTDAPKRGDKAPNKIWTIDNPAMSSVPRNVRELFPNLSVIASDQDCLNLIYWSIQFNEPDGEINDVLHCWWHDFDNTNS